MKDLESMKDNWDNNIKKGLFQLLVLTSIKNHEKEGIHGAQILEEINAISRSTLNFSVGAIYPYLRKLEKNRFIEKQEVWYQDSKQKRKKILYRPDSEETWRFNQLYTYMLNRWNELSKYITHFTQDTSAPELVHERSDKEDFKSQLNINQDFLLELAILSIIITKEKPILGPKFPDLLKTYYNSNIEKSGRIYPILHKLEAKNFVVRYENQEYDNGLTNRLEPIYIITEEGRKHVHNIIDQWSHFTSQISLIKKNLEFNAINEKESLNEENFDMKKEGSDSN